MKKPWKFLAFAIFLLLFHTTQASAGMLACPKGQLATAQAATGASTNTVVPHIANALVVQYVLNSGTSAVVETQICCSSDCTATGDWAQVTNSSFTINAGAPTAAASVLFPTCLYRAYATACTGCDVDVFFQCSAGGQ
jgi:hypothetical protein